MQHNQIRFIGPYDCPFRLKGTNIAELRRAQLRKLAGRLDIDMELPKNDMLKRMIRKLEAIEAPEELTELSDLS